MFINVPNEFSINNKECFKDYGLMYKGRNFYHNLYSINDLNHSLYRFHTGNYAYNIVIILDTYIFIIGKYFKQDDLNLKNVDFLSEILKFEYDIQAKSKYIKRIDLNSDMFCVLSDDFQETFNERCLEHDLTKDNFKMINNIIDKDKPHLKDIQEPMQKFLNYVVDNKNLIGRFTHGFCKSMYADRYLLISNRNEKYRKGNTFNGYIIKFEHSLQ